MADSKTSALTAVVTPAGTDEFPVNQGGTSKKETLAQVKTFSEAGTAGGRTIYGGTASGEDLTLVGNSAAADGEVVISRLRIGAGGMGVIRDNAGEILIDSGQLQILAAASGLLIGSNIKVAYPDVSFERRIGIAWSNDTDQSATKDAGLARDAAGVVRVTDGSTGYGIALADGVQLKGNASKPAAGSAYRGMIWYTPGGAGVADTLEFCFKDNTDTYSWVTIL